MAKAKTTGTPEAAVQNPDRQGARPWSELKLDVQEKLNELLAKTPSSLVPGELEFLKGRRPYLTSEQRADFDLE